MKGWIGKFRALLTLGLLALVLTGCGKENLTALVPKGYGAESSMNLIILSVVVMTFVFLAVIIVYTIVLFRFREKKGQEDYIPKQVEGNKTLETIWTVIPIILVVILAVPTIIATFDLADVSGKAEDDSIVIDVTGNQYWWHFNYKGEEIQTSQDMYIPTDKKVYLNVKSSDVIHSFWVPSITGKMDANVENTNEMYIEAYEEGVYWGKCAELCGPSHSLMDFKVIAVSLDEYDQWVSDMQNVDTDKEPESKVARQGKNLFEQSNCMSCHAIGSSDTQIGPNLTNFGNRTKIAGYLEPNKENLKKWIKDPEKYKPGNKMTGNYPELSDDEIDKIAEYLMQLKHSDVTRDLAGD